MEDNEWFNSEESFISWISAYYPAPSKFVSAEERKKNALTWERFFDNMRIATGEEPKYSKKYNHVMNESRRVLTQNDSEGINGITSYRISKVEKVEIGKENYSDGQRIDRTDLQE